MGKQVCPLPSDDGFRAVYDCFRRFYSGEKMRLDAAPLGGNVVRLGKKANFFGLFGRRAGAI